MDKKTTVKTLQAGQGISGDFNGDGGVNGAAVLPSASVPPKSAHWTATALKQGELNFLLDFT